MGLLCYSYCSKWSDIRSGNNDRSIGVIGAVIVIYTQNVIVAVVVVSQHSNFSFCFGTVSD